MNFTHLNFLKAIIFWVTYFELHIKRKQHFFKPNPVRLTYNSELNINSIQRYLDLDYYKLLMDMKVLKKTLIICKVVLNN